MTLFPARAYEGDRQQPVVAQHEEQRQTEEDEAERISSTEIRMLSQLHRFLDEGELLSGKPRSPFYEQNWQLARADSFDPLLNART